MAKPLICDLHQPERKRMRDAALPPRGYYRLERTRKVVRFTQIPQRIYASYVNTGTPLVLSGGAGECAALREWNETSIRARVGARTVPVRTPLSTLRMSVTEFLDTQALASARDYQLHEIALDLFLPELQHDLTLPELVPSSCRRAVSMGIDTFCAPHFHRHEQTVITQLTGTSHVVLYSPEQRACLYPAPWYARFPDWSRVTGTHPDERVFPRFRDARVYLATLHAGDALYVPVHWWHARFGTGFNISVAYFWWADPAHWVFPFPGLRALFSPRVLRHAGSLLTRRARAPAP